MVSASDPLCHRLGLVCSPPPPPPNLRSPSLLYELFLVLLPLYFHSTFFKNSLDVPGLFFFIIIIMPLITCTLYLSRHVTCTLCSSRHVTCTLYLSRYTTCTLYLSRHATCTLYLLRHATYTFWFPQHAMFMLCLSRHVTCTLWSSRHATLLSSFHNTSRVRSGCHNRSRVRHRRVWRGYAGEPVPGVWGDCGRSPAPSDGRQQRGHRDGRNHVRRLVGTGQPGQL